MAASEQPCATISTRATFDEEDFRFEDIVSQQTQTLQGVEYIMRTNNALLALAPISCRRLPNKYKRLYDCFWVARRSEYGRTVCQTRLAVI